MNKSFFRLVLALLPAGLALSQEPFEQARDRFCQDPHTFVCRDSDQLLTAFRARRLAVGQQAFKQMVDALGAELTTQAKAMISEGIAIAANPAGKTEFRIQLSREDYPSYLKAMRRYLVELEKLSPWNRKQIDDAMSEMKRLHSARIQAERRFSPEQRAEMVKRVEAIHTLSFDQIFSFFEGRGLNLERDLESALSILSRTLTSCGGDFLRDNGSMSTLSLEKFFTDKDGKRSSVIEPVSMVVVCPGSVLALSLRGGGSPVSTSLLHEIGHAYDVGEFRPAYEKLAACVLRETAKSPELTWWQAPNEAALGKAFWAATKEIIADYASAEVLAQILANRGIARTMAGLDEIRQDLAGQCGIAAGSRHPSGKYRIGSIFGANPLLRATLGCPAQNPEPVTCTLDGRYPQ